MIRRLLDFIGLTGGGIGYVAPQQPDPLRHLSDDDLCTVAWKVLSDENPRFAFIQFDGDEGMRELAKLEERFSAHPSPALRKAIFAAINYKRGRIVAIAAKEARSRRLGDVAREQALPKERT